MSMNTLVVGLVVVAHNSGGPRDDILKRENNQGREIGKGVIGWMKGWIGCMDGHRLICCCWQDSWLKLLLNLQSI